MKKQFFFTMFAAAAVLASCSSESAVSESAGGGTGPLLTNGEGYVSLAINLPTVSGTTRAANDNYDDGTVNEYAVSDATLILFTGSSESGATLSTAYNLNLSFNNSSPANDNITSTAQIVQKINDSTTGNYYALVVLNNNGIFTVNPTTNKLSLTSGSVDLTGKTLAEFITATKMTTSATQLYDNANVKDFFMSNAPLYTAVGGATLPNGEVQTLAVIDPSKVYETEAAAAANPATEVCVERAVAKVTLRVGSSITNTLTGTNHLSYAIQGWQLDNTNTESYLVRNVANGSTWWTLKSDAVSSGKPYRFVGDASVVSGLYRTYWGEDPNYTGMAEGAGVTYWDEKTNPAVSWLTQGSGIAYCAENTFDVANQKDINTTTAIVKVQFNSGADFYTINNSSSVLYDNANLISAIKSSFLNNTAIKTVLTPLIATSQEVTASDLTVTLSSTEAGIITVSEIVIAGSKLSAAADKNASELTVGSSNALAIVNAANTIRLYKGGIAYYPVHIKHFGDDLTPWRNGETNQPSAGNIYPSTSAANYLGRYGVLRNNWYDIEVTAIKELGTATVPTLGNTRSPEDDPEGPGNGGFDDDIDQYIAVKINILSWAKRTQSVTL